MAIQVRRGNEADFDADKMLPGEWAVSLDTKYVRMCFSPGVCLRMATYEAFEADMVQIQAILSEVQTIEEAVARISSEVSESAIVVEEYTEQARKYRDEAKQYRDEAHTMAPEGYESVLEEIDALNNRLSSEITSTTSTTLSNSQAGGVKINSLHGASEQAQYSGAQLWNGKFLTTAMTTEYDAYNASVYALYAGNVAMPIEVGKQYSFSVNGVLTNIRYVFLDSSMAEIDGLTNASTTVEAPQNAVYLKWRSVDDVGTENIMLNAGSTALPWEPYVGGTASPNPDYPQEIESVVVSQIKSHGKNKLKNTATTTSKNGGTFTVNTDGSVTVNGTFTADTHLIVGNFSTALTLQNGNYILSGCPSGGSNSTYRLQFWNYAGTDASARDHGSGVEVEFSNEEGTGGYNIAIYVTSGTTVNNLTFYPMIRKADVTDATYEPYQESTIDLSSPITLRGIGDVKDYIDVERGKVVRHFTEVVLDGSEYWATASSVSGTFFWSDTIVTDMANKSTTVGNLMCDKLTVGTLNEVAQGALGNAIGVAEASYGKRVILFIEGLSTVAELKTWLSENNVTFVYELATQIEEDLPTADQIALRQLQSFDTVTYISSDSEIEPSWDLEYGSSKVGGYTLEALNIAEANEINISAMQSAILSLGGNV